MEVREKGGEEKTALEGGSRMHSPKTTLPFHRTNIPNAARKKTYGPMAWITRVNSANVEMARDIDVFQ